ncbi:glucose-6-phosphate isomerase [Candidatus Pelagibacter sp.]|uniref:glucose-6-phosphate isomerase n=1 Tax=Candidatus Pelagibacter sp. TaxID=2024849 RepID=UPI003F869D1C
MLTKNIDFINFKGKYKTSKIKLILLTLLKGSNEVIKSLSKNYNLNYDLKEIKKYKKSTNYRIIGMGGSCLGSQTIYDFLKYKIKKNFVFINNLNSCVKSNKKSRFTNLVISKSGNTIETIVNANVLIKKNDSNIFITENKKSYLYLLAQKLKADVIHHSNYIGGRYSVLSEVGMLPAELMGLNPNNFKRLNNLVSNKYFLKSLIENVGAILHFSKKKKFNSIIINYDSKSENLFNWYQQLVAESLGKNKKGILPIISNMPKDNHSVMQLYLDGFKNNFFTFFSVRENKSKKIINQKILSSHNYLKNKNISNIIYAQLKASENVFKKKNIPYRSFEIKNRSEQTLGELFCFFILETILLGKCMNINPYNQPAVELIKKETKRILI